MSILVNDGRVELGWIFRRMEPASKAAVERWLTLFWTNEENEGTEPCKNNMVRGQTPVFWSLREKVYHHKRR
jgi:hypothetical protein